MSNTTNWASTWWPPIGDTMETKEWPKSPLPGSFDGFVYVETGDAALDAANRLQIFNITGTIPQRFIVGMDVHEEEG